MPGCDSDLATKRIGYFIINSRSLILKLLIVHPSVNDMKSISKSNLQALTSAADLIGDFIRYWGFRKIHGEIWTIVYLSKKPVSGSELVEILDVSKALVSPALKELEEEGLIFQTESENSKTKRYRAVDDVFQSIKNVLNRREKPLIERIVDAQQKLGLEVSKVNSACHLFINHDRYENLKKMTDTAQLGLAMVSDFGLD